MKGQETKTEDVKDTRRSWWVGGGGGGGGGWGGFCRKISHRLPFHHNISLHPPSPHRPSSPASPHNFPQVWRCLATPFAILRNLSTYANRLGNMFWIFALVTKRRLQSRQYDGRSRIPGSVWEVSITHDSEPLALLLFPSSSQEKWPAFSLLGR